MWYNDVGWTTNPACPNTVHVHTGSSQKLFHLDNRGHIGDESIFVQQGTGSVGVRLDGLNPGIPTQYIVAPDGSNAATTANTTAQYGTLVLRRITVDRWLWVNPPTVTASLVGQATEVAFFANQMSPGGSILAALENKSTAWNLSQSLTMPDAAVRSVYVPLPSYWLTLGATSLEIKSLWHNGADAGANTGDVAIRHLARRFGINAGAVTQGAAISGAVTAYPLTQGGVAVAFEHNQTISMPTSAPVGTEMGLFVYIERRGSDVLDTFTGPAYLAWVKVRPIF
jgi:hypothetical protein